MYHKPFTHIKIKILKGEWYIKKCCAKQALKQGFLVLRSQNIVYTT